MSFTFELNELRSSSMSPRGRERLRRSAGPGGRRLPSMDRSGLVAELARKRRRSVWAYDQAPGVAFHHAGHRFLNVSAVHPAAVVPFGARIRGRRRLHEERLPRGQCDDGFDRDLVERETTSNHRNELAHFNFFRVDADPMAEPEARTSTFTETLKAAGTVMIAAIPFASGAGYGCSPAPEACMVVPTWGLRTHPTPAASALGDVCDHRVDVDLECLVGSIPRRIR